MPGPKTAVPSAPAISHFRGLYHITHTISIIHGASSKPAETQDAILPNSEPLLPCLPQKNMLG